MIIVPTRELAEQVTNIIKDLSNYTNISILKVIGGTNLNQCRDELSKNPNIVVGTPGRILDMIRREIFTNT